MQLTYKSVFMVARKPCAAPSEGKDNQDGACRDSGSNSDQQDSSVEKS